MWYIWKWKIATKIASFFWGKMVVIYPQTWNQFLGSCNHELCRSLVGGKPCFRATEIFKDQRMSTTNTMGARPSTRWQGIIKHWYKTTGDGFVHGDSKMENWWFFHRDMAIFYSQTKVYWMLWTPLDGGNMNMFSLCLRG